MIIRERTEEFVMIAQHDHAQISGEFAKHWKETFFLDLSKRESVELAVKEHDRGWIRSDKKPLWNDEENTPYTFMDYPLIPKLRLYKTGIHETEAMDTYAGLLCSEHYVRFTSRNPHQAAQDFVRNERERQRRLKENISGFKEENFQFHYDLLAFCDNLSLYTFLNEPGCTKKEEHPFFQQGLPIPSTFSFFDGDRLPVHWGNQHTIYLAESPFEKPVSIKMKQKIVSKREIASHGFDDAYKNAPVETVPIWIKQEDK